LQDNISVKKSKENTGKTRDRDQLENLAIDGRTILKWIFKKWYEDGWTGLI
jgi:hypothetical protein